MHTEGVRVRLPQHKTLVLPRKTSQPVAQAIPLSQFHSCTSVHPKEEFQTPPEDEEFLLAALWKMYTVSRSVVWTGYTVGGQKIV